MRRRVFWFTLLLLTLMFCLPSVVLAQEGDTGAVSGGEVALLLAPLVAAAAVIERVLEMLFSWYESVILNAGSFLGLGGKYVRWAQQRLESIAPNCSRCELPGPRRPPRSRRFAAPRRISPTPRSGS